MNHSNLDETDRRILRLLQADASLSHAAIAEQVGASATSCWRRIRLLEEAGVLTDSVRLVNPARIGRGVSVMLQVRLKSHASAVREDFEGFVTRRPEIMECYSMSGEWDYHLRIVVAGVEDYQAFLMNHMLNHANVATTASHFALGSIKYVTALPI
jgi:Lrp/AsnC family transcriptional regulator